MTGEAAAGGGDRMAAVRDWLHGHADRPLARLALLWLRRYLEASRNSGAAAGIYFTLSALPTALVVIAFFNLAAKNENAFSNRLIAHMKLDATTANLVGELLEAPPTTSSPPRSRSSSASSSGGSGSARSTGTSTHARGASKSDQSLFTDQVRFAIWFFAASGLVALMTVSAANLRSDGWLVLVPAWIAASIIFWLWTPRFLLHRKVTLRALLPGALLASLVLGATVATAPLWTGPTVNQNAHAFGSLASSLLSSPISSPSSRSRWPALPSRPSGLNGERQGENIQEEAAAHAEHACRTADDLRRWEDDARARSSRRLTADERRSLPPKGSQSVAVFGSLSVFPAAA